MINVLIADDSIMIRNTLRQILNSDPDITIAGTASNGKEAVKMAAALNPDVITMDIEMPVINGIDAIKQIMSVRPVPILVITQSEVKNRRDIPFQAISAGALDIIEKPAVFGTEGRFAEAELLIDKVKTLSRVNLKERKQVSTRRTKEDVAELSKKVKIVVIGASVGGPKTLNVLFSGFRKELSVPVIVVQHIGKEFQEGFVSWLRQTTGKNCVIVDQLIWPQADTIYFAQGGRHIISDKAGNIKPDDGKPVNSCRPSIDVLFNSIVTYYGNAVLGILLTGMGDDGARGLLNILKHGGNTIAQNEASSIVYGMPQKAAELGAAQKIISLEEIKKELFKFTGQYLNE